VAVAAGKPVAGIDLGARTLLRKEALNRPRCAAPTIAWQGVLHEFGKRRGL
jgi:hypothetical protein